MRQFPPLAAFLIWLAGSISLPAQTPAPSPAAKPLLRNGGFELGRTREDLWDGVDNNNFLAGERDLVPILTTSGAISESSMPLSVAVADMNGDKLLDIVTMDVIGYLRIYFNSGTATEPKFTNAEIGSIYLTRSVPGPTSPYYLRYAPRIALFDSSRSGKNDIFVGNYWGEIFQVKNDGSTMKPEFRQPNDITRLLIPTAKDSNTKWGNVFSPAVWDWDKDGKEDLILGEGSYSANNIHLLLNSGGAGKPVFDESNRSVLAFGDGREQLSTTVVDYNGDGNMDLLVSERTGKVALYLNKGGPWKPGTEIPFASFVNAGNSPLTFGGICTITTADLNGDGLFDIIGGKTNGRIAVAYNTGTKTEPKFSPPVELKGEGTTKSIKLPSGWDVSYGLNRGNYYAYANVVTEAEDPKVEAPEGKAALKFGYQASPNKVMAPPAASSYTGALVTPYVRNRADPGIAPDAAETIMRAAPANYFLLRMPAVSLKPDTSYSLTFKTKGAKVTSAQVLISWTATLKLSDNKTVQLDRGVKIIKNELTDEGAENATFSPGAAWGEVKKDFKINMKDRKMNDPQTVVSANFEISFQLAPGSGELYIDDVKLIAK